MTDNGLAALAAALQEADDSWNQMESTDGRWRDFIAAAILGERGVFLPDGLPHDCQTSIRLNQGMAETNERLASEITEQAATIATLRAQYAAQLNLTIEANSTIATLNGIIDLNNADIRDRDESLVMVRAAVVKQREEIATLRAALDGLDKVLVRMMAHALDVGERVELEEDKAFALGRMAGLQEARAALAATKETP